MNNEYNTGHSEKPLSPPPYEVLSPIQQQPPPIVVSNTTVVQNIVAPVCSVPIETNVDRLSFNNDTPKPVRCAFIRNLFFLISAQFILVDGIIAVIMFVPVFHDKMMNDKESKAFYITWAVSIVILGIISFWERARRIPPANYVTIILFTILQGITLGCAATYEVVSLTLLTSVGTTSVVCLATALFQLQSRYYLGNFRSVLYVWGLTAACFGISVSFLDLAKAGIAAGLSALFCTYLVVNAQMMVHGTTRYLLTPKEYVFGAMNIYVDIVHGVLIFLAGIGLFGTCMACCCRRCVT